jgi:N utilization substance protein A
MAEDPDPLVRLFALEVPEIAAHRVEIKAIARRPGYRSKVALLSRDPEVDCIEACVGRRACRLRRMIDLLGAERIDLVRWSDFPETFIANALSPATLETIVLNPEESRAVVFIRHIELSLVLGRRGVNRQLAGELTGWQIDIEELWP